MNKLKIIKELSSDYSYQTRDITYGFNDSLQVDVEKKSLLAMGANHSLIIPLLKDTNDYFKMFLHPEEPNGYTINNALYSIKCVEDNFDLIFTLCKYSDEWRKKYYNTPKRIYSPMPYSTQHTFASEDKDFDVFFSGHSRPSPLLSYIHKIIKNNNGKIVDASQYGPISQDDKMKLNGKSKISISYSLLFTNQNDYNYVRTLPHWIENEAFSDMGNGFMPQIKGRTFEAAFSKSIILHKFDKWNVIEDWFVPNEDFIYFTDEKDLEEKIYEILKNYDGYKYIAENAYNKAMNKYTTESFIKNYILSNTKI
jgi:glycosyltransferase involved in cell wall biosynthesis